MNAQELLTKPIEKIGTDERMCLAAALLADFPKSLKIGDDMAMMLFDADGVKPMEVRKIARRNYLTFKPTQLVFLPQACEVVDVTTTERRGWISRIVETKKTFRIGTIPADVWSLLEMFSGCFNALSASMTGPIPASAFIDHCPFVRRTIHAGVDVSIAVSHNLTTPANFRALLFGVPLK